MAHMDVQNLFYLMGSIFMILGIIFLIGIIVLLFYIKNKVSDLQNIIEERVNELTHLTIKPVKRAAHAAKTLLQ